MHIGAGREAKLALIGQYWFTLAFENAIEPDYVTEKLYDALTAGSVPVYLGAPNVRDFAPADHCYIDASRFAGPVELAAYLNGLVEDERAYGEYLAWKTTGLSSAFRAIAARVERPALERLCTHLRATFDPSRLTGGRPTYPIRSAWYGRVVRRIMPSGLVRRRDRSGAVSGVARPE